MAGDKLTSDRQHQVKRAERAATIEELLVSAHLTRELAEDGTHSEPQAQIMTVQAIVALKGQGSLKAIATKAGLDDNTVQRAIEVLVRPVIRETPSGPRTVRNPILWKVPGRGGKPNRYGVFWGELQRLARDEHLALFAGRLAAGELDPAAAELNPVEPPLAPVERPLNPVARQWGEGGEFLGASQEQEISSSSSPFPARHGGEPSSHGVEVEAHGGELTGRGVEFDPIAWQPLVGPLQAAGIKATRLVCQRAHERGLTPIDLADVVAFYAKHAAAWASPGAINHAILNWPGANPADLAAIFPTAKDGYRFAESPAEVAERTRREAAQAKRQELAEREEARNVIITNCRAEWDHLPHAEFVTRTNLVLRNRGQEELAAGPCAELQAAIEKLRRGG